MIKKILVSVLVALFLVGATALFAQGVKNPITQEQRDEWAKIGSKEKAPQFIESFDQAKDLAIKEGKDVEEQGIIIGPDGVPIEITAKGKIYKKGGLGENGFWTFYTIKYFTTFDSLVIIIYKPESGSVIILRRDTDISQTKLYSIYIEDEHSRVNWGFLHTNGRTADGFVAVFLRPMEWLLVDSNWEFTPTEKMRHEDCWKIEPKKGANQ